ncbi:unnamed protein product [Pleuronectes platessa]|uniref:Uncharacterized protein n=1 Tax=Pleuronectes platessa TaxID=8262 RepID=A0A9N7U5Q1_PLEPL|nr:unnamed protein product [Pleuronectes platessa]
MGMILSMWAVAHCRCVLGVLGIRKISVRTRLIGLQTIVAPVFLRFEMTELRWISATSACVHCRDVKIQPQTPHPAPGPPGLLLINVKWKGLLFVSLSVFTPLPLLSTPLSFRRQLLHGSSELGFVLTAKEAEPRRKDL